MEHVATTFFEFETDFVRDEMRCIPMIVRYKLDCCRIKLTLKQWGKMNAEERHLLATAPLDTDSDCLAYSEFLSMLILATTREQPIFLSPDSIDISWKNVDIVPDVLVSKLMSIGESLSLRDWKRLSALQRFALVKLATSAHESKNLRRALVEFNVSKQNHVTDQAGNLAA